VIEITVWHGKCVETHCAPRRQLKSPFGTESALKRTVRRGVNPFERVSSVPAYGFNRRPRAAVMANAEPNDLLVDTSSAGTLLATDMLTKIGIVPEPHDTLWISFWPRAR
jgi:hypothetical protein